MARRFVHNREQDPRCFPLGNFDGDMLTMCSLSRFPIFDNDFGWGKPVAVRSERVNKFDGVDWWVFTKRYPLQCLMFEGFPTKEVKDNPFLLLASFCFEAALRESDFTATGSADGTLTATSRQATDCNGTRRQRNETAGNTTIGGRQGKRCISSISGCRYSLAHRLRLVNFRISLLESQEHTHTHTPRMATRHLLRRSHRTLAAARSASTAVGASVSDAPTSDRVKRLGNPNPRFLRYNSPHPTLIDHTSILTYPATRVTTLNNGLRVATESNLAAYTATVCVWIDTGSRFETEETNGAAHFLEHMVFRGTSKRSGSDLDEEIENMGGILSGFTSREQTVYVAKVMAGDVAKVLDILSDMLQNSTFDEKLIKDERNEIMTEFLEVIAQPQEVIFDRLHATAFQHNPLGRTVLGPPKSIMDMTKKDLQDYLSTHYTAHRMVISASGSVKHEEIVEQVNKMFTKLSTNPITTAQLVEIEPAIFTASEVIRKRDDDTPLAHFAIVFKGASWTDPDSIALLVMRTMLGSWDKTADSGEHTGSQLAQIAGIDELAESVMAVNSHYKETGLFGVYAAAKPDCLDDLASAIMQEMSKLCYRVTEEDVISAQNELKSLRFLHYLQLKFLFCKEQSTAEEIGRQLLTYRRRIPLAELFARIDAVDVATVKRVANKFIFDQDIAIAASGAVKLLPDYNWFRSRTSMICH
ncbi:hypothetical protein SSX86_017510 [Deinandra increscens subsp. villosa]|uniref:Mitochondrial processing peptidase beta subunit n=1 Tax=Deinandra increscens subsp. villosa TaxID=3103831 RepID=A0AAP0D2K7_9ASTR